MHRYSKRLPWSNPPNTFSRLLAERRRASEPLLDLTISNPTQVFADYPHAQIKAVYDAVADFRYNPDPLGQACARESIAGWYAKKGVPVSPAHLALTASTSEAYSLLFKLLCNPGDEVLIPVPSYPLFEHLALLESVKIVPYRLVYDGSWFVDFTSLRSGISPRTRAIVIVNPNNPTGSFLKRNEKERLFEIAREHTLPIVSDEVFMDFPLEPAREQVPTLIGHDEVLSFSLNGLSKSAGMPQMKLGWIAINGPAEAREIASERLELLLDTYLSVATPVQNALEGLLSVGTGFHETISARLKRNKSALESSHASPVNVLKAEAGWSAILQVPNVLPEDEWIAKLLAEYQVVAQPGYFFDMTAEAYLIVSLITPPEDFAEAIQRIRLLAERL